jgi:hypothetical protein
VADNLTTLQSPQVYVANDACLFVKSTDVANNDFMFWKVHAYVADILVIDG